MKNGHFMLQNISNHLQLTKNPLHLKWPICVHTVPVREHFSTVWRGKAYLPRLLPEDSTSNPLDYSMRSILSKSVVFNFFCTTTQQPTINPT